MVRTFRIGNTDNPGFNNYKDLDYRQVIAYLKEHPNGILNIRLNKYGDIIGKGMDISKLEQTHYMCRQSCR